MRDLIRVIGWVEFIVGLLGSIAALFTILMNPTALGETVWWLAASLGSITAVGVLVMFVDLVQALAPERPTESKIQPGTWTDVAQYNRPHALNAEDSSSAQGKDAIERK